MEKRSLGLVLLCSMATTGNAMQWGASTPEEIAVGLQRERQLVVDTMRAIPGNEGKTDAQLKAELDAESGLSKEQLAQLAALTNAVEKADAAQVLENASRPDASKNQ